ncbi:hypothetical protein ACFLTZ_02570 [Chloroflexota bacterium]
MGKRWQMKKTARIFKVGGYATGLLLAVIIGAAPVGFLPAAVQADTNPVDLVLGGPGATSWTIGNMEPGDNGTKVVELHNAGSRDGFVTIWVSDVASYEGMNPESETGNTTEPGEYNDHLLLNLSSDGLTTKSNLPTTINNLPQSVSGPGYIEIIPLKAGNTVDLQWGWELPVQAGNDVQGDKLSFTINYLLQEVNITDVSDIVTDEGVFIEELEVKTEDGQSKITIAENITGLTKEGEPAKEIWIIPINIESSHPSENTTTIGAHFEAGPEGTTFDQPITITFNYDPNNIPYGVNEEELILALWDNNTRKWVELEGCIVDTVNNTITAPITHFSRYTIISPSPPPTPPSPTPSPPPPRSDGVFMEPLPPTTGQGAGEGVKTVQTVLETNMLGEERTVETEADGTLRQRLKFTDPDGRFVIEVDSGSKITSSDGMPVTRLDLSVFGESIAFPADIVILSAIYKLTGYVNEMEIPSTNFNPPAELTILYDPRDLPENVLPPFVAYYTADQGLVPLEPPPGSTFEIGKAKAQINHASLFVVAAEVALPPPPLPARFKASGLSINPRQAQTGETIAISLTIANEGATEGTSELLLIIDGIVRAVEEVTLTGGSSETLTFRVSNLAIGSHQVKVAGLTGQFKIIRTAVSPGIPEVNWLVLDVSVSIVLVLGLCILYLTMRRSHREQRKGVW